MYSGEPMAGTAAVTLSISRTSARERNRALPLPELWLEFAIKSPAWNSGSNGRSSSKAKRSSQVVQSIYLPLTTRY